MLESLAQVVELSALPGSYQNVEDQVHSNWNLGWIFQGKCLTVAIWNRLPRGSQDKLAAGSRHNSDLLSYRCRLPSLEKTFPEGQFTIDLSLNHLKVQDVDVLVRWLEQYSRLRIVINDNYIEFNELRRHFEQQDKAFALLRWALLLCKAFSARHIKDRNIIRARRFLTGGRLHFSSTLLHLLTESVHLKQMEKVMALTKQTKNVQNWQKKANFAIEDEVNSCIHSYYEAQGYAVAPLAIGARSAGFAMFSPKIPAKGQSMQHLYSFDGAYYLTREADELVVLGEVKHSLDTQDVQEFKSKVALFNKRLSKIRDGTLPTGSPAFNLQNDALRRYLNARIKAFVGTVHVQPTALAAAAKEGYDIVLPSGARFEMKSADEANELAKLWLATAPGHVELEEDEC